MLISRLYAHLVCLDDIERLFGNVGLSGFLNESWPILEGVTYEFLSSLEVKYLRSEYSMEGLVSFRRMNKEYMWNFRRVHEALGFLMEGDRDGIVEEFHPLVF